MKAVALNHPFWADADVALKQSLQCSGVEFKFCGEFGNGEKTRIVHHRGSDALNKGNIRIWLGQPLAKECLDKLHALLVTGGFCYGLCKPFTVVTKCDAQRQTPVNQFNDWPLPEWIKSTRPEFHTKDSTITRQCSGKAALVHADQFRRFTVFKNHVHRRVWQRFHGLRWRISQAPINQPEMFDKCREIGRGQ